MPARTSLAAVRNPVRLLALVCLSSLAAACASSGGGVDAVPTTSVVLETSTQPSDPKSTNDTVPTTEAGSGAPTPTFAATSDAFRYGDDSALDALWDACAAGSGKACDDLYFAAPIDSEYEQFGYTCGDRTNEIICTEIDDPPAVP
jgi:hypothetical protein